MNLFNTFLFLMASSVVSTAPAPSLAVKGMTSIVAKLQKSLGDVAVIQDSSYSGTGLQAAEACEQDLNVGKPLEYVGAFLKPAECSTILGLYQQFSEILSQTTPGYVEIANSSPMQQRRLTSGPTVKSFTENFSVKPLLPQFDLPGRKAVDTVSFIDNLRKKCASSFLDIDLYTVTVTADLESISTAFST